MAKYLLILLMLLWTGVTSGQAANEDSGAAANREYDAVFSRSAHPCSADYATVPYERCMAEELATIESHLDAFIRNLRGITDSKEELDALNRTDSAWRAYREAICAIPETRFAGGSIRGPIEDECRWTQDRAYMEQLNTVFVLKQQR